MNPRLLLKRYRLRKEMPLLLLVKGIGVALLPVRNLPIGIETRHRERLRRSMELRNLEQEQMQRVLLENLVEVRTLQRIKGVWQLLRQNGWLMRDLGTRMVFGH